jgi:hypothetical protein
MKIAEYIYSIRTGGLRGRGVYILHPDWWLERPRSISTPRGLKVLTGYLSYKLCSQENVKLILKEIKQWETIFYTFYNMTYRIPSLYRFPQQTSSVLDCTAYSLKTTIYINKKPLFYAVLIFANKKKLKPVTHRKLKPTVCTDHAFTLR